MEKLEKYPKYMTYEEVKRVFPHGLNWKLVDEYFGGNVSSVSIYIKKKLKVTVTILENGEITYKFKGNGPLPDGILPDDAHIADEDVESFLDFFNNPGKLYESYKRGLRKETYKVDMEDEISLKKKRKS